MRRPIIAFIIFVLTLFIFSLTITKAQSSGSTTGSIIVTVKDSNGNAIVGATVSIRQVDKNFTRSAQTDNSGISSFIQSPPDKYEIKAEANGFAPQLEKLVLTIGTTALIEFNLSVSELSDLIEVKGSGTIDSDKTESSTNIDSNSITNLPINMRNFLDFSLTVARITPDRLPKQGGAATSGLSFNGQTPRSNNITVDGLTNNDGGSGSVLSTFSQDAVQEFQIVSDNYSAEFGRAIGGIVNIVTKGGSNEYHGNLFLFNRNDSISARNAFADSNPEFKQYQFGALLSGPIKKDKIFFFGSFERLSLKQNNIITISDQSVSSARRLGLTLDNGTSPFSIDTSTALTRIDARLSANDSIWARYNYAKTYNGAFDPFGGLVSETNSGALRLRDNLFAFNNTYISAPLNLVNETRFLYQRRNQIVDPNSEDPFIQINAPEGMISFGRNDILPMTRILRSFQFVDNVTLIHGRNQIKFGGDFFIAYVPDNSSDLPAFKNGFAIFNPLNFSALTGIAGLPSFSGLQTFDAALRTPQQRAFLTLLSGMLPTMFPGFPKGVALADLALPTAFIQSFGEVRLNPGNQLYAAFFQDDIKLRPNLLLKLGLRYDLKRTEFTPSNNGNISPRIALFYHPGKLENLRMHANYGIFFDGVANAGLTFLTQLVTSGKLKVPIMPFPYSVVPFALPGHHFPQSDQLPSGFNFIPQLSISPQFDPNLRNSYSQQIGAGVDYLMGKQMTVSADYSFVRGIKLLSVRNINPIVHPILSNPIESFLTGRSDPTQGDIDQFESAFDSYYHALTLSINKPATTNIGFIAHYTLSKAIDNFFDYRPDRIELADPLHLGNERGLSVQDLRNRFVISGIWHLNYTRNLLLKDFQLSTIITLESGRPYNLLAGQDLDLNGDFPPADRPAGVGRDVGITPGFANVDLRLKRDITVKERYHLSAIAEAFNLFNRVNINDFDDIFPPDDQGNFQLPPKQGGRYIVTPNRYRGSSPARQFQLGFRLSF